MPTSTSSMYKDACTTKPYLVTRHSEEGWHFMKSLGQQWAMTIFFIAIVSFALDELLFVFDSWPCKHQSSLVFMNWSSNNPSHPNIICTNPKSWYTHLPHWRQKPCKPERHMGFNHCSLVDVFLVTEKGEFVFVREVRWDKYVKTSILAMYKMHSQFSQPSLHDGWY